jgi:hypothetical protein
MVSKPYNDAEKTMGWAGDGFGRFSEMLLRLAMGALNANESNRLWLKAIGSLNNG